MVGPDAREDLPYPARPLTSAERELARELAATHGQESLEEAAPIQMVGSGTNLNEAADNGIARLAALLEMPKEEVLSRVTISGAVADAQPVCVSTRTGRHPADKHLDSVTSVIASEGASASPEAKQHLHRTHALPEGGAKRRGRAGRVQVSPRRKTEIAPAQPREQRGASKCASQ